jgi:hypothetical protein
MVALTELSLQDPYAFTSSSGNYVDAQHDLGVGLG